MEQGAELHEAEGHIRRVSISRAMFTTYMNGMSPCQGSPKSNTIMITRGAVQGKVAPVLAFGLLQHESRLSVLNFALKKASSFKEPLANKSPLLFVTGFRQALKPVHSKHPPVICYVPVSGESEVLLSMTKSFFTDEHEECRLNECCLDRFKWPLLLEAE